MCLNNLKLQTDEVKRLHEYFKKEKRGYIFQINLSAIITNITNR